MIGKSAYSRLTILLAIGIGSPFFVHAQFVERSAEVGIDHKYNSAYFGGGAGLLDINNDNLLDIYLTGGSSPDKIYLNTGSGFEQIISYLLPEDFEYYEYESQGVATGDFNNDGFDDIFVSTQKGLTNLLLINNGNNTFDVIPPAESGIADSSWSISAALGDINSDGLLDIFVTNYVDEASSYVDQATGLTVFTHLGYRNNLYINQGGNTFIDESESYGITALGTSLAATFTNFDQDGDMDLYVVNDFGQFIVPNELYKKDDLLDEVEDVGMLTGANIGLFGMGIAIGDYDNDLDLDYYVTNIGRNSLLRNNGNETFSDVANEAAVQDSATFRNEAKVGWGTGFFDYDNDGRLDLFVSNGFIPAAQEIANPMHDPNALFRNLGNGTFKDVSEEMQVDLTAVCRGGAYGDLDNDGDLDLIFVPVNAFGGFGDTTLREKVAIYYNESNSAANWIEIRTVGTTSNRNGYGAHLYLYDQDGKVQLREVDGGSSHASSNSPFVHFGIGDANAIDSLIIYWPSGKIQRLIDPGINQLHVVIESDGSVISSVAEGVAFQLEIFPNPVSSMLTVAIPSSLKTMSSPSYEIYSTDGKVLDHDFINSNIFEIDLSNYSAGYYYLSISAGGKQLGYRQIVKE